MYVCSSCSFSSRIRRDWDRHHQRSGHTLKKDDSFDDSQNSDEDIVLNNAVLEDISSDSVSDMAYDGGPPADQDLGDPPDEVDPPDMGDPADLNSPPPEQDPWYPWLSRAHYYLSVLYHGSHRRNFDTETLRAVMDIMKMYVPATEYFPTIKEVIDFTFDYWHNKILETRIDEGNVLAFLRPEGILAMRLSNPIQSLTFDRVPRKNANNEVTSQSSSGKFNSFEFMKLGDFLKGDLVKLKNVGEIAMEGYEGKVPCQFYFQITAFYIKEEEYKVEGNYFFHSSLPEMTCLRDRVNDNDAFILVKNVKGDLNFQDLKFDQTLRSRNIQPTYSRYMYDEATPNLMYMMSDPLFQETQNSLGVSEQAGCLNIVINIHIDDASMIQSKMWKSASVCDIQLAGSPAGVKGNEFNNIIVGLTDTSKISLKRLFDGICGEFVNINRDGFECYDCFTGKIEKVKAPVAAVFGDLPAKAEISPFKGFQADVFCGRDMFSKRTLTGSEIRRDQGVLKRQIQQIQNERTQAGRKRLGVKFGLDINNLESILDSLPNFDLTLDFPQDLLHHFTLGWGKKSFIYFKNEILNEASLDQICQIFDQIIWKEYKSRTTSSALRKSGSQIGRNIKSLLQFVWYGIWILIWRNPELRPALESFLRTFFYMGKLNYLFYNEHEVAWTDAIFTEVDDSLKTILALFKRDLEVVVPGPKTHDLELHLAEDIKRHGAPAGFDCQAGEAKMKIQKLKNNYSNHQAPGTDVATKYLKTEIVRHIVTGGALSEDGKLRASENVLQETLRHDSFKNLLGIKTEEVFVAKASLMDYVQVNGKSRVKLSRPTQEHMLLGIPDKDMKTCNKIQTANGPLFRKGGLGIIHQGVAQLGILTQVYKSSLGVYYAVVEKLRDVTAEKRDPFLTEAKIKVWKRSGSFFVTKHLYDLLSVPILHACSAEEVPSCTFLTGMVEVREERQSTEQRKTVYDCLGRDGDFFIVNVTAFSVPIGIGVGCF